MSMKRGGNSRAPLNPLLCLVWATTVLSFNVTLSDQSPAITYLPSRSGPADTTWNVSYAESDWATYSNQTIGEGASWHYTTSSSASASLGWVGTAVYVWGQGSADVSVDGKSVSDAGDGLLGWWTGDRGWHEVSINNTGRGVNLTGITVTLAVDREGPKYSYTTVNTTWGGSSIDSSFKLSNRSQWEVGTIVGGGTPQGSAAAAQYDRIDTHSTGAQLSLQPPANTSFILLYGSVNFDHTGLYNVSLADPGDQDVQWVGPAWQVFHGESPWIGLDEVTYFAALDPTVQWQVTVEHLGTDHEYWDMSRVVYISSSGYTEEGASSSSRNAGAIAGGVVGGLLALLLVIGAWFFLRRRRRAKSPTLTDAPPKRFEVEPYEETTVDARHLTSGSAISGQSGQSAQSNESRFSAGSTSEPLIPADPAAAYASAAAGTYAYTSTQRERGNRYSGTPTQRSSLSHVTPLLLDPHTQTAVQDVEVARGAVGGAGARDKSDSASYRPGHRSSIGASQTQSFYTTNGDVDTDGRLSVHPSTISGTGTESSVPSSPTKSSRPVSMDRPLSSPAFSAMQTQPQIQMHALVPTLARPPAARPRATPSHRLTGSGGAREAWTQETDAGRVFVPPTEHGGTVPPVYDPAWRQDHPQLAEQAGDAGAQTPPSWLDTPPLGGVHRVEDQTPIEREADAGSLVEDGLQEEPRSGQEGHVEHHSATLAGTATVPEP